MSEEEKIRRAEQIAEMRNNRIPANSINSSKKTKISTLTKISIQILTSICIFGLCYFLHQNNSYALEIIKPIVSSDTDFQKLYSNLNYVVKNFMQEANAFENTQSKENINKEESESENEKARLDKEGESGDNKDESNVDESKGEGDNGNEGERDESNVDESHQIKEKEDDIAYIKRNVQFIKPVNGTITSKYGEREGNEIISANHEGVDIGAEIGTEIAAAMKGTVEYASEIGDYGKHIKITNGEISTLYAHCSEILVNSGDQIEQGKIIAKVGTTGKSTGPHLHFEIRRNDTVVNPEEFIEF